MKTILAPVDFSDATDAVVAEATALARALHGRVVLFNVVKPPSIPAEYPPLLQDAAEIIAEGEKHAAQALAGLEAKICSDFVTAEHHHAVGAPISLILEEAAQRKADYIVIGSHGHTALYELLIGGTAQGVLKRAKCPVLIVPATKVKGRKSQRRRTVAAV
ncbi:MAG TPA: universal stress protein [Opitutaceae bacterium]|nr:universal stress protein [Opitutaceae bacterium]